MVSSFPGLFHINERVAWMGHWEHGFFSMTAVGATNVGSIQADFEPDLRTNQAVTLKRECTMTMACSRRNFHFSEKMFTESGGITKAKGQEFGHFNFGSTIVLIFEAPEEFQFGDQMGSKVQVGQKMMRL
jgi:phosphatidylserine decarboxylase